MRLPQVTAHLKDGKRIRLRGLGTLKVRNRPEKHAHRHPPDLLVYFVLAEQTWRSPTASIR
jgi:Bacterial DNA-binding protein